MATTDTVTGDGEQTAVGNIRLSLHADIDALEYVWRDFEQRADCTVFQSFAWLSTWQRHVGRARRTQPAIVIGRDPGGHILFLLPLAIERRHFVRCLTWLGTGINDYNAPLLAPGLPAVLGPSGFSSLWPRVLDRLQREGGLAFDLVHFERMPRTVGAQANPFLALPVTAHPSGAYLTHLTGDWETFYAHCRSAATRKRDRRKRKHLEEAGKVRFITPGSQEERTRSFDTLVAQKTRTFAAMGVPNMFRRAGYAPFYRALATGEATREIAHLSRLDVGAAAAAVSLGLRFRGSYYLVLSSYDGGELSRLSPGSAHLHELMRHAIDTGCGVFDFTVGDEPYKRDWAEGESVLFDHVRAARPHATLMAVPLAAGIRVKRAIKQTTFLWDAFIRARALAGRIALAMRGNLARAGIRIPRGEAQ